MDGYIAYTFSGGRCAPGVLSKLSQLCAPLFKDPVSGLLKFVEGVRAIESAFGHDSRSD